MRNYVSTHTNNNGMKLVKQQQQKEEKKPKLILYMLNGALEALVQLLLLSISCAKQIFSLIK